MNTEKILKKVSAGLSVAVLIVAVSACAHNKVTEGTDYGQVRTEASATQPATSDQVVGTAPAPSNAQGVDQKASPAIISGPAKVDDSGRAYTSSSAGGSGNGSATGLNTNVNIIPAKSKSSVTVTQSPTVIEPAPVTTVETTPAPVVTETQTTTETVPMASSTTQETTTTTTTEHRRLRKD